MADEARKKTPFRRQISGLGFERFPALRGRVDFGIAAGFYVDATQDPWYAHYRMYSYVTAELPGVIGANFAADMTRQSIFGHSMGGHGALTLALRNPSQYQSEERRV